MSFGEEVPARSADTTEAASGVEKSVYCQASDAFYNARTLEELHSEGVRLTEKIRSQDKVTQLWIRNAYLYRKSLLNEALQEDCRSSVDAQGA